jgi:hypothetical protein
VILSRSGRQARIIETKEIARLVPEHPLKGFPYAGGFVNKHDIEFHGSIFPWVGFNRIQFNKCARLHSEIMILGRSLFDNGL